jgi:predicted DNA-binding transcriptional regulator AlpA
VTRTIISAEHAQLLARLRAANPVPPSSDPLNDPDLVQRLWRRIGGDDVPVTGEDAEPPRIRKPTLVARQATLPPPTLLPRLICRDASAAYVGVSATTFDKMISDGLMPKPRRLTERRLAWDVRQLDAAIDRLPIDGDAEATTDATDHSWDDIDAQAKTKSPVH